MSSRIKQLSIMMGALALGLVFLGAAPAEARGRGRGPSGGPGMGPGGPGGGPGMGFNPRLIEAVAGELGVTDATLTKIKDLIYETQKAHIKMRGELETAHLELRRLMDTDQPKVDAVMRQVDKIGGLETKFKKSQLKMMLAVRGMLTPEQRTKLKQIMANRRGMRKAGRGGGAGFGPGAGAGPGFGGGPRNGGMR